MSVRCPVLNPSGAKTSVVMRMCGRMDGPTPSYQVSNISVDLPRGETKGDPRSHHSTI
jgi:hypothetical protein